MAALAAPHCSAASRDSSLSVVESLLAHTADAADAADPTATTDALQAAHEADSVTDSSPKHKHVSAPEAGAQSLLAAAESLVMSPEAWRTVLAPHVPRLLVALRAVVLAAMGAAPAKQVPWKKHVMNNDSSTYHRCKFHHHTYLYTIY